MKRISTIVFIVAALVACSKKKSEPAATVTAGSAVATGSAEGSAAMTGSAVAGSDTSGSAAGSATAEVEVPTEMDFEDDATAKVTDKNLEAELQSLEKDLGK